MSTDLRKQLTIAGLIILLTIAGVLIYQEGTASARQKADAALLKDTQKHVEALQDTLAMARATVDTIIETVTVTVVRTDTTIARLDSARVVRPREDADVNRMRSYADSLIMEVDPNLLLGNSAIVRAAYAYREVADTLRHQKARVDLALDRAADDVHDIRQNMVRVGNQLADLTQTLGASEDEVAQLRRQMITLRSVRECKWLGIVTCPSRTSTGLLAAGVGLVAGVLASR